MVSVIRVQEEGREESPCLTGSQFVLPWLSETGSKENLRLLGMIKIIPFFNTECKNG